MFSWQICDEPDVFYKHRFAYKYFCIPLSAATDIQRAFYRADTRVCEPAVAQEVEQLISVWSLAAVKTPHAPILASMNEWTRQVV